MKQDFSTDPHWEGMNNRVVGDNCPTIQQDFGWRAGHPTQRVAGIKFTRFGLMNIRRGGKYVTVYLDDLSYTARHPKDYQPIKHERAVVHRPYPPNGRKY